MTDPQRQTEKNDPGTPTNNTVTNKGEEEAKKPSVNFAPDDPTDGRAAGEWRSRYDAEAQKAIRFEAVILGILWLVVPLLLLAVACHRTAETATPRNNSIYIGIVALSGGMFGGTTYSIKWLYHVTAKWAWNFDRRLWRLFSPILSSGLGFATVMLVGSGIFKIFDASFVESLKATFALAFLAGYFSDMAVAKMTEIASTLFGTTHKGHERKNSRRR
jgi:hypothetical protein